MDFLIVWPVAVLGSLWYLQVAQKKRIRTRAVYRKLINRPKNQDTKYTKNKSEENCDVLRCCPTNNCFRTLRLPSRQRPRLHLQIRLVQTQEPFQWSNGCQKFQQLSQLQAFNWSPILPEQARLKNYVKFGSDGLGSVFRDKEYTIDIGRQSRDTGGLGCATDCFRTLREFPPLPAAEASSSSASGGKTGADPGTISAISRPSKVPAPVTTPGIRSNLALLESRHQ